MTDHDPNDAYKLLSPPGAGTLAEPFTTCWIVAKDGIPVRYFPPDARKLAELYISDPAYRARLAVKPYEPPGIGPSPGLQLTHWGREIELASAAVKA